MRRIWDMLGAIIITALVIYLLIQLIKPYVGLLLLATVIVFVGSHLWRRYRQW